MTDSQLTAILTAILDILAMNTAYADDRGQTNAIAKARELVASATKNVPLGGETK